MNVVQGPPPNPTQLQNSSGGGKNRACIILCCLNRKRITDDRNWPITSMEYNICIVDLKSDIVGIVDQDDGFTLVSPTFQIDCGADKEYPYLNDAFCVLGQTLYVFEGSSSRKEEPYASSRKSVFALDLTRTQTLTQRTTKLAKDGPLLEKIGDMTFPKSSPAALPTPEGEKIVVFSQSQYTFELFEPANRSWEQLPPLIRPSGRLMHYAIRAYGFVQDSCKLLVQTDLDSGLYALDLASDKHWVKVGAVYSGVERIPCGGDFFETVEESRFCFVNSSGFYDLEEHVGEYDRDHFSMGFVPHPFERGEDTYSFEGESEYYVALLNYGDGKGECDFCHMEMERPSDDGAIQSCRTEINVCRVDLKSYKEMADQLSLEGLRWSHELKYSKTRIVKRLRFSLCFEGNSRLWGRHLFFTF